MPNPELKCLQPADVSKIIETELYYHPEAQLLDMYKLLLQSYYGQGHFIPDIHQAESYLKYELSIYINSYLPVIQDISNGSGLYRISLEAIRNGKIALEDFLLIFARGIQSEVNWLSWQNIWSEIEIMLLDRYPQKMNKDQLEQCKMSIRQKKCVSHTECFKLTYNPHYRVMQITEEEIKYYKI